MHGFFQTILPVYAAMLASLLGMGVFLSLLAQDFWQQSANSIFRGRYLPLVIILTGLVLRFFWIDWTQPVPESDFLRHWQHAQAFYNGNFLYTNIERHPGIMVLSTFAMYLSSPGLWAVWGMNIAFSAVLMLTMYQLALNLFNRTSALIVLGVLTVHPQFIAYCSLVATEVASAAYMMLIVWAILYHRNKTPGMWYYAALGAVITGSILIRSTTLLLAGAGALIVLAQEMPNWRMAFKKVSVTALTAFVLFMGWCGHQYTLTGSFKPFYGMGLWLASAANAESGGRNTKISDLPEYKDIFEAEKKIKFSSKTQHQVWFHKQLQKRALEVIMADPVAYLKLGFVRIKRTVWTNQTGITWSIDASTIARKHLSQKLTSLIGLISTHSWQVILCLSPLGLLGFFIKSNRDKDILLLLTAFIALWAVFHYLLSIAAERYNFQIIPFVFLLTTGGINYLLSLAKNRLDFNKA